MRATTMLLCLMLAGCRYEMAAAGNGVIYRLNTWTGDIDRCVVVAAAQAMCGIGPLEPLDQAKRP